MKRIIATLSLSLLAACGSADHAAPEETLAAEPETYMPADVKAPHHKIVPEVDHLRTRTTPWLSILQDGKSLTINTPSVDHNAITIGELRKAGVLDLSWNSDLPDDWNMFPVNCGAVRFAGPQAANPKDRMPCDERFILSPRHARLFSHARYRTAGQLFAGWRQIKTETRWAVNNCLLYKDWYARVTAKLGHHDLSKRIADACRPITQQTEVDLRNPRRHLEPWRF